MLFYREGLMEKLSHFQLFKHSMVRVDMDLRRDFIYSRNITSFELPLISKTSKPQWRRVAHNIFNICPCGKQGSMICFPFQIKKKCRKMNIKHFFHLVLNWSCAKNKRKSIIKEAKECCLVSDLWDFLLLPDFVDQFLKMKGIISDIFIQKNTDY